MDMHHNLRLQMYWEERLIQNIPIFSACSKYRKIFSSSVEERQKHVKELFKTFRKDKNGSKQVEDSTSEDDSSEDEDEQEFLDEIWADKYKFIEVLSKKENAESQETGENISCLQELRKKYYKIFNGNGPNIFGTNGENAVNESEFKLTDEKIGSKVMKNEIGITAGKGEKASIMKLSDDLLIKIFTSLKRPAKTLGRAALISTRMKEAVDNDNLWKYLFLERFANKLNETIMQKYTKEGYLNKDYEKIIVSYYKKADYKLSSCSKILFSYSSIPLISSSSFSCTALSPLLQNLPGELFKSCTLVSTASNSPSCFSSFSSSPCFLNSASFSFYPVLLKEEKEKSEDNEEETEKTVEISDEEETKEGSGTFSPSYFPESFSTFSSPPLSPLFIHSSSPSYFNSCNSNYGSDYQVEIENHEKEITKTYKGDEQNKAKKRIEKKNEENINWKIRYGAKHSLEKMFCNALFDSKMSVRVSNSESQKKAILDVEYGGDGSLIVAACLNGCTYVISSISGKILHCFSLNDENLLNKSSINENDEHNASSLDPHISVTRNVLPQTVSITHNISSSLNFNYNEIENKQKNKFLFETNGKNIDDYLSDEKKKRNESHTFFLRENESIDASFLNQKPLIMSGYSDSQIRIWDFLSGKMSCVLKGHNQCITVIELMRSNKCNEKENHSSNSTSECYLLSACTEGIVKLWDLHQIKQINRFGGHKEAVNSICFDPANQLIFTGSKDRYVHAYDRRCGENAVLKWPQHKDWVMCVDTPRTHLQPFTLRSAEKSVNTWDIRNPFVRICIPSIYSHQHRRLISGLRSDALRLISCSFDGSVKISSEEFPSKDSSTLKASNDEWIMAVDFYETQLITGMMDGSIEIYNCI